MEEINNPSGISLLVPSVQELAKENISILFQPDIFSLNMKKTWSSLKILVPLRVEIPVIDLQSLLSEDSRKSELAKLHLACKDWGFFWMILLKKVKLEIQDFFNLPMSEKKKFWQSSQHMEGFGQAFVVSEEQKLDWCDMFYMTTLPTHLRIPHLFPHLPLPFRNTLELYSKDLKKLDMDIVEHVGKALNMEETEMRDLFEDGLQSFRMNYYHPCPQAEKLINHGVNPSFLEKVKLEIQQFFNLPMSEKKKFWQSQHHMEGFGQAFVVSEEQTLDWADMFYMVTLPKHLRMPHLFPHLPLPFRETLELYSKEVKTLAMVLIAHVEKALKMKEMELGELFEDGIQMIRMNYYPPCPQPEKVIGLINHSDPEALTILLQLNEVEGLQIRKNGIWVPIKPLPNAFIVNIGDILEIMTNGIYRSIEHRAVVNSDKERLSIATFYSPTQDSVVGPAASLVTEETQARFNKIGVKEFFARLFAQKLYGKSFINFMRIGGDDN